LQPARLIPPVKLTFLCVVFCLLINHVSAQSTDDIPIEAIVTIPEGFSVDIYARGQAIGTPTVLTFGADGRLYILSLEGRINAFEDRNGDGYAESQTTLYDNADAILNHAVGLTWYQEDMYISDSGRISIISDADQDGLLDTVTPIIEGLVSLEYWGHSNNGIAFGPDERLYVGIGSTTDHGPMRRSREAMILAMNPDGSDVEVFATGLRNPYDLTFSPDGDLFTADNNPDRFDRTLRYLPSEELNHIRQGHFYGFPEVFGEPYPGHNSTAPVTNFFPSVASAGLAYYSASQFPSHYRNGVYVAQWGSIAHPVQARDIRNGYLVAYVPLTPTANGTFTGDWEVFAMFHQDQGEYRPVDVTVGSDGALYILEYNQAVVYRVKYTGDTPSAAPTTQVAATTLGERLYREGANGAPACIMCHLLETGIQGVGPSLRGLQAIASDRVSGLSARAYVRISILNPNAYIVNGFAANLMYQQYGERFSEEQVDALIDYVLSLPSGDG
jgi:glucose/arabinose dehydrogenase